MEIKMALISILKKFKFERVPETQVSKADALLSYFLLVNF